MACGVIDDYLRELATSLPGGRSERRAILAEIEDGLNEAAHDYRRRGFSAADADTRAVREFGSPALIAATFAPIVSAKRVHRHSLGFVAAGPAIAAFWIAAAVNGVFAAVPTGLAMAGIGIIASGAVVAAATALAATAITGHNGWMPRPRYLPPAQILLVTSIAALIVDGSLLAALLCFAPHTSITIAVLCAVMSAARVLYSTTSVFRLAPDRASQFSTTTA